MLESGNYKYRSRSTQSGISGHSLLSSRGNKTTHILEEISKAGKTILGKLNNFGTKMFLRDWQKVYEKTKTQKVFDEHAHNVKV
jgi:hypothetical protein